METKKIYLMFIAEQKVIAGAPPGGRTCSGRDPEPPFGGVLGGGRPTGTGSPPLVV